MDGKPRLLDLVREQICLEATGFMRDVSTNSELRDPFHRYTPRMGLLGSKIFIQPCGVVRSELRLNSVSDRFWP